MSQKACKLCEKDISRKGHNAIFCSNKGIGNCKDEFHNAEMWHVAKCNEMHDELVEALKYATGETTNFMTYLKKHHKEGYEQKLEDNIKKLNELIKRSKAVS